MPNNAIIRGLEAPQLVVMDLLGVFMENNDSVKAAIAAAFQAHGVRIDEDLAASSLGFPKTQGIERVLRWLHPLEQPHKETVRSIHALAVKELTRMMTYAGSIEPSSRVVRLCEQWHKGGVAVAAVTTLQSDTVKAMHWCLRRKLTRTTFTPMSSRSPCAAWALPRCRQLRRCRPARGGW